MEDNNKTDVTKEQNNGNVTPMPTSTPDPAPQQEAKKENWFIRGCKRGWKAVRDFGSEVIHHPVTSAVLVGIGTVAGTLIAANAASKISVGVDAGTTDIPEFKTALPEAEETTASIDDMPKPVEWVEAPMSSTEEDA